MKRALVSFVVVAWAIIALAVDSADAQQKSLPPVDTDPLVLPPMVAKPAAPAAPAASGMKTVPATNVTKSVPAVVTSKPAAAMPLDCGAGCCAETPCCNPSRFTFSGEYLLWWMSRRPMPDNLVTTGPVVTGNPLTSSGPLGNPGTATIFGGSQDAGTFSGGRITAEYLFDPKGTLGFQASGFLLEDRTSFFSAGSNAAGSPILTRPVFDVLDNKQSAVIISYPGAFAGGITVASSSRLWGAESNLFTQAVADPNRNLRFLVGFRYLDLQESENFLQATTVLPGATASLNNMTVLPGQTLVLGDSFHTRNQIYGGQIGAEAKWAFGALQLGVTTKFVMGVNHEMVDPEGSSLLFVPGSNTPAGSAQGGVLALRTNSGQKTSDHFVVIPEVALKAGWQFSNRVSVFAGYSFLYVSDVVRPGEQINQNINVSNAPTSIFYNRFNSNTQPNALFNHTDYWVHGVNFGVEFKF